MTKATDLLSRDEIRSLTGASDLQGWRAVGTSWGLIAASLAACAAWPHPLVVACAVVVVGGRQLGLAVLMHEASHGVLFRTRTLNELVGTWLCAAPVWTRLRAYREHHRAHHVHTGTSDDPDLGLVRPFPTTPVGLARKIARDLLGIAALRRAVGLLLMDTGFMHYTASTSTGWVDPSERSLRRSAALAVRHLGPVLATNAALLGVLAALGHAWVYAVWLGAWCTTYGLFLRVRSIAEHACTARSADPLRNTRTTRAGWLARLTVAPHYVNYHLEHHLLMTVPCWRLPELHALLRERGAFGEDNWAPSYTRVLRLATVR